MKNETIKVLKIVLGILLTALVIWLGIKYLRGVVLAKQINNSQKVMINGMMDFDSLKHLEMTETGTTYDEIDEVYQALDESGEIVGYFVFANGDGYNGNIQVVIATDETGKCVKNVKIGSHNEKYGEAVDNDSFLQQFKDKYIPFKIGGVYTKPYENSKDLLNDGIYRSMGESNDGDFIDFVEIEIKNGKIYSVLWDGYNNNHELKSTLSKNESLEEPLNKNSQPWHIQAQKMQEVLKNINDPLAIPIDEDGYPIGISDVDINISSFINLAQACIESSKKSGEDNPQATDINAVSGATITSRAVVNIVNIATEFIINNYAN